MKINGADRPRKNRLLQMVDLAQVYCECSKAELAQWLNRDPAKIVPDSGNPKLDLVFNLAKLLEWSVGDVAEALWFDLGEEPSSGPESIDSRSFNELNHDAILAHRAGDHARMRALAQEMVRIAGNSIQRACAATRMMGALDLAGGDAHERALDWARVAAAEPGVSLRIHLLYVANLAIAHYAAWNLQEAMGVAEHVIRMCEGRDMEDDVVLFARALSRHVAGNAQRQLITMQPAHSQQFFVLSRQRLSGAIQDLELLAKRRNDDSMLGIANTCRGAIVEVDVETAALSGLEGARQIAAGLESVVDPASHPRGDWLESWGWWAVIGLGLAVRHLEGEARERYAAVFSTKAQEIADRLGNWAIRERVFTLEHDLRFVNGSNGATVDIPANRKWVMDREDVRNLLGTMGRFHRFRRTGWNILRQAIIIND